jgi:hypothetical protein
MICASLYRPFSVQNLLRYLAEKILLLNTTNFWADYPITILDAMRRPRRAGLNAPRDRLGVRHFCTPLD